MGIIAAILAFNTVLTSGRIAVAAFGFILVIVVGTAMLFIQRVLDVGLARKTGTPLTSSFGLGDKFAFGLMLIASVSNGLVIALQIARQ